MPPILNAMPWFACHVVMTVRFKDGFQNAFPAWDNVYLVEAADGDEAAEKSEQIGRSLEGDSNGTFEWDKRPARWAFAGVRKCMQLVHPARETYGPADGVELTYCALQFEDETSLRSFVEGHDATAVIQS